MITSFTRDSYTISSSSSPTRRDRPFLHLRVKTRYTCHDRNGAAAGKRQQFSARRAVNIPVPRQTSWGEKQKIARGIAPGKHIQRGVKTRLGRSFHGAARCTREYHSSTCTPSIAAAATVCCARTSSGLCGGVRFPACLRTYTLQ